MHPQPGSISSTKQLGELLRAFRKSRGLSQVDAAALAGVGERFLSELERGKATAEVGLVLRVIERFGLTLILARRGGGPMLGEQT
jgi:y4mF family transcriptional regulator